MVEFDQKQEKIRKKMEAKYGLRAFTMSALTIVCSYAKRTIL